MSNDPLTIPLGRRPRIDWLRILVLILLAVLAFRALVVPAFVLNLMPYPVDYFYGEGDELFHINRLLRGLNIYNDSTQYPFSGNIYPPVFFWIAGGISHFFGATLATLRALMLIPLAGVMFFIGLFLRREKAPAALITAAVLLAPVTYGLSEYLIMPRVDGWMALFALGSFYFFAAQELKTRDIVCGGVLAALALFTKQTAIFGLAAVNLHLLLARPRKGLAAGACAALACGLLLGVSLWQFGPQMLDSLSSLTARRTWIGGRFNTLLVPSIAYLSILGGIASARLAVHAATRRWELLDTYIVGHCLPGALIMFDGGGINYLLPLLPGLCLAAALSLRDLAAIWPRQAVTAAVALAGFHVLLQSPCEEPLTMPDAEHLQEACWAAAFLSDTEAPVFAERLWGAIAGKEQTQHYFVEPVHLSQLPPGRLDRQVLLAPFLARRFARVIVFRPSYLPRDVRKALQDNYEVRRRGKLMLCFRFQEEAEIVYLVPRKDAPQGTDDPTRPPP